MFVVSLGALVWRVLSWPPTQSPDAWAYVAWGQALAAGQRPAFAQSLTTPKPLGTLLGAAVSPLPPQRAFQAAVIVSLAALAAALFWVAYRLAGTIGATVALAALGFSAALATSLRSALVDGIAAALVMLALATRGRTRLVCLIVVGLGRPEAWPLAGVAAYADAGGSVRRRLVHAALATAAAPLIWVLTDLVLTGDPLATLHRTNARRERDAGRPYILVGEPPAPDRLRPRHRDRRRRRHPRRPRARRHGSPRRARPLVRPAAAGDPGRLDARDLRRDQERRVPGSLRVSDGGAAAGRVCLHRGGPAPRPAARPRHPRRGVRVRRLRRRPAGDPAAPIALRRPARGAPVHQPGAALRARCASSGTPRARSPVTTRAP